MPEPENGLQRIVRPRNDDFAPQKRQREMWAKLKAHFNVKHGKWPSYREMAPVARELGYADYADAWERS